VVRGFAELVMSWLVNAEIWLHIHCAAERANRLQNAGWNLGSGMMGLGEEVGAEGLTWRMRDQRSGH
jgi:hypothetical protein